MFRFGNLFFYRRLVRLDDSNDLEVKLTNKKRKWAIDQAISGRKTIQEIAEIYDVSERWIQIIVFVVFKYGAIFRATYYK